MKNVIYRHGIVQYHFVWFQNVLKFIDYISEYLQHNTFIKVFSNSTLKTGFIPLSVFINSLSSIE